MKPDFIAKNLCVRGLPVRLEIMMACLGAPPKQISKRGTYMLKSHSAADGSEVYVVPGKLAFTYDGKMLVFENRSHAISLDLAERIARAAYVLPPRRTAVLQHIGAYRAKLAEARQGELQLMDSGEVPRAEALPEEEKKSKRVTWLERTREMLTRVLELSWPEAAELNRHLSLANQLGIDLSIKQEEIPPPMAQPVAEAVSSPVFELLQPGEIGSYQDLELSIQREATELRTTARALYARLEVLTRFTEWWPRRCEQLVEGEDYGIVLVDKNNSGRGRPAEDYWLTADAAKYICMLEKTALGDAVRRSFIQAEKQLRLTQHRLYETERADRLTLTAQLDAERAVTAALRLTAAEPLAFYEALIAPGQLYSMKQAAATLTGLLLPHGGVYVGHEKFMEILRRDGHLLSGRASANDTNHPSAEMLRRGLMRNLPKRHPLADAKQITNVPRLTGAGLAWMKRTYCPMPERHLQFFS